MMYIREKLQKKSKLVLKTFFHPKLVTRWFPRSVVPSSSRQEPPAWTGSSARMFALALGGDSVATLEESKQLLWNRDFVHTAAGVKFTLRTSQSADADQKLASLPLQMYCSVAAREVQREKILQQFCLLDSSFLWGFPKKHFEWFVKAIWYLNFQWRKQSQSIEPLVRCRFRLWLPVWEACLVFIRRSGLSSKFPNSRHQQHIITAENESEYFTPQGLSHTPSPV